MIRQPFTPAEVGVDDETLAATAGILERYAEQTRVAASPSLVASILDAVEAAPPPRRGWLGTLGARRAGVHRAMAMAATAVVLIAAVGVGFLAGRLIGEPEPGVGTSPSPSLVSSPSPTQIPSPTSSPSPSPSVSPSGSAGPTSEASASEDASESAEPSATGSDDSGGNSGPGGGGGSGGNSGPGGGDD